MRHGVAGKKFGRNQKLREATLRDLVKAVLINFSIRTTRVKAGEARKLVDRMITLGKKNTLATKRRAFALLCDHGLVSDLFNKVAPLFVNRHGGYTRIIKLAVNRQGDNAEMVILELTEKPVVAEAPSAAAKDKKSAKPEVKKAEDAVIVADKKPKAKKPAASPRKSAEKAEPKEKKSTAKKA
jgi:large subunit ribosomal protein L17